MVECDSCGTTLDPIQVLLEFAYQERSLIYAENKVVKAEKRLEELKKEEKNIKSRLARAKAKGGE
jgi:hypothetical protein